MAGKKQYDKDKTFVTKKLAKELAEKYGTPLFIYDKKTFETQIKLLYDAFSWNQGFLSCFPVRMLNNPHLLRIIHESGCAVQCCNEVELRLAEMAGIPGSDILFTSCFPSYADWRKAVTIGATILLDRPEQLEDLRINEYGDRPLGLRLSVEGLIGTFGLRISGLNTKLGMSKEELFATAKRAALRGFKKIGLYASPGGDTFNPAVLGQMTKIIMGAALELYQKYGLRVCWCHIGGDIVWDVKKRMETSLDPQIEPVRKAYCNGAAQWTGWRDIPLIVEAGQFIAMPAGVFLTRVVGKKIHNHSILGTELSSAHVSQAIRGGLSYHVSRPGFLRIEGREVYHIVGMLPEPADMLSGVAIIHPVEMGDLLLVHDTGCLARAYSNNFCGVLRCPEVLLDEDGPRMISRRETFEDFTACLL